MMSCLPPFSLPGHGLVIVTGHGPVFAVRRFHAWIRLCAFRDNSDSHKTAIRRSPYFIGKLVVGNCLSLP
ncbi:MAG: hypothetical protein M1133_02705 [Armatimonadetes bacterium]|nr:hypothetical protein [Armatimonadota bacterium]